MKKSEARAILACKRRIERAVDQCLKALSPSMREYAEVYWAGHILGAIRGQTYGSAPIVEAERIIEEVGRIRRTTSDNQS